MIDAPFFVLCIAFALRSVAGLLEGRSRSGASVILSVTAGIVAALALTLQMGAAQ